MYKETILSFQRSGLECGGLRYEHYLLPFYRYFIYLLDTYQMKLSQRSLWILFCLAHVIIQVVWVCTANLNLLCAFLQPISIWGGQPCLNVWLWATGVVFLTEELFRICCTGEMERAMKTREKSTHQVNTFFLCFYFLHMYRYKIPCLKFLVFLFLLFSLFS